jgi:hypothetical protein
MYVTQLLNFAYQWNLTAPFLIYSFLNIPSFQFQFQEHEEFTSIPHIEVFRHNCTQPWTLEVAAATWSTVASWTEFRFYFVSNWKSVFDT